MTSNDNRNCFATYSLKKNMIFASIQQNEI